MNIHLLKHLTVHVKNWGPLWSYSCFGFESVNGDVKKLFHGTCDMSEQVNTIFITVVCIVKRHNVSILPQMIFSFSVVQNLQHVTKLMSPHGQALIRRITGKRRYS